jgi:hypothetical protein
MFFLMLKTDCGSTFHNGQTCDDDDDDDARLKTLVVCQKLMMMMMTCDVAPLSCCCLSRIDYDDDVLHVQETQFLCLIESMFDD